MGFDKISDLRAKSDDQLGEQLGELGREAFNLRFQSATGQLERPSRIREVRRGIARIQTLQAERANGDAPVKAAAKKPTAKKAAPKKAAPKPSRSKRAPKKK
ncbi:50S ribosomal protein L29 [Sphingorhabdus soli]|uniref:Large ribosomal subunit protein uL29 n=1 Tax=Flavisphingopyxis soli TaxID=2601267 RepID=A0A5C6ULF9_9SPHN|nr:50S ribosomal protein L29 [Sphingorhabdus soli]